jgi:hypothetical protein
MPRLQYPAPGLTPSKVKWLLESGATVDRFGGKARRWAEEIVRTGDVTLDRDTVRAMVSAGADTDEFEGQARRWAQEALAEFERESNPKPFPEYPGGECDPEAAFRTELLNQRILRGEKPGWSMTFMPGSGHVTGCPEKWPEVEARVDAALRSGVKIDLLESNPLAVDFPNFQQSDDFTGWGPRVPLTTRSPVPVPVVVEPLKALRRRTRGRYARLRRVLGL